MGVDRITIVILSPKLSLWSPPLRDHIRKVTLSTAMHTAPSSLPLTRLHRTRLARESGIALLLVIFTLTLLSIMSIALTQSTYIGSKLHRSFVDRFRAELLLRSAVNVALEIIAQDPRTSDPPKDSWGPFIPGRTVPADLLGIPDPRLQIGLEITSENSKIPLSMIVPSPGNTRDREWREILARLFVLLEFDDQPSPDHTGLFGERSFSSKEMVANLVDYLDEEPTSFSDGDVSGIEAQLPKGYFSEKAVRDFSLNDLVNIPGFSPERLSVLAPYVTPLTVIRSVNINLTAPIVLQALDGNMQQDAAREISAFAQSSEGPFGPYNQAGQSLLTAKFTNYQTLQSCNIVTTESAILQIIAKVQFGDRRFFARARVQRPLRGSPDGPQLLSREFFG